MVMAVISQWMDRVDELSDSLEAVTDERILKANRFSYTI